MYIYNHHSTGSFLPVSSNRSSKDSDPPSADQDQPCFCMLFCSVDHSVYNLSIGSGQYSYIPCCACVLLSISKRNEPDASCISLCYADCMLSWFSFLCYLSYIRCHLSSTWTKYRILSRIHDRTTDLSGFRRYHLIKTCQKISRLDGYEFPQCLCLADCVYFPMLFYFSRFYLYSTQLL